MIFNLCLSEALIATTSSSADDSSGFPPSVQLHQENDQTEKLTAAIWHEMNADRRGEGGAKSAARDWFIPNISSE